MSSAARATLRVALRQLSAVECLSLALAIGLSVYDRLDSASVEDPMEALH
jgi:hypothetical protein